MAFAERLLGNTLRTEMKRRVDQILSAATGWQTTADKLTAELKKLNQNIEEGKVDPKNLTSIAKPIRGLSKNSAKIAKAFTSLEKTLVKISAKYG